MGLISSVPCHTSYLLNLVLLLYAQTQPSITSCGYARAPIPDVLQVASHFLSQWPLALPPKVTASQQLAFNTALQVASPSLTTPSLCPLLGLQIKDSPTAPWCPPRPWPYP